MRYLSAILILLISISANADVVKGRVIDAQTKEPLEGASVTFTIYGEKSTMSYTIPTDSLGIFIGSSPAMKTEINISFIGYYDKNKRVACVQGNDTIDVGNIELVPNEILLNEVAVSAHAKRFTMRGDTVVFHPEAFKMEDGDRVAKLIQKLPGVTEKDGQLYWNGRPISLRMNGEKTLSNDLVSQLPAEAVKEIKGYDKQSEYAERTGKKDGNEEQVLDIVIKPGFLEKWYGQAKGSAYTLPNYEASLSTNYLSTHNPLMAFFRVGDNNTKNQPIGYQGNMIWQGGSNLYRQQIGALGYQHLWNPKFTGWKRASYWNIESHIDHVDERYQEATNKEFFTPDNYSTLTNSETNVYNHSLSVPLNFKGYFNITPTLNAYIPVEAKYTKGRKTIHLDEEQDLGDEFVTPVNKSHAESVTNSEEKHIFIAPQLYKYVGKNEYMFGVTIDYTGGTKDYGKTADYDYVQTGTHATDNQSYHNNYHNFESRFGALASIWLSEKFNLETRYRFKFADNYSMFDRQRNGQYDFANSSEQSDRIFSNQLTLTGTLNIANLMLKPSVEFALQNEHTDYMRAALDTTATRTNLLPTPKLEMTWRPNKQNTLRASVLYQENLPDIISTLRYVDDTNPLYIFEGNPDLKKWKEIKADINYTLMIPKHEQMFSVALKYNHTIDPLQDVFYYNTLTGAYRYRKENTKGGNTYTAELSYDRALNDYWEWKNTLVLTSADAHGVLTVMDGSSEKTLTRQSSTVFSYKPSFVYQRGNWKLTLNANAKVTNNSYQEDEVSAYTLYNYGGSTDVQYTFLKKFTINLQGYLIGRKGYNTERFNRDDFVMNAAIWYKLLKNKLTLRIDANDIFNKYISYTSTETSTSRAETTYASQLHHYAMFTVTYDFDAKGGKKK